MTARAAILLQVETDDVPGRAPARPLHSAAEQESALESELDIPALYRRYGDLVLGRCRTILRNDADAQDAMQEVFLKLHRFRDSFRGDASPSTFLYRITTTTCLNRIRGNKRRREEPVAELPAIAHTDSVLDQLALRDVLDQLLLDADPTTRECLVYHYVDGMTHEETGEMVGLSGAAVRKRIAGFRGNVQGGRP